MQESQIISSKLHFEVFSLFRVPFNFQNIFRYEYGETENCLELWNRDGKVVNLEF